MEFESDFIAAVLGFFLGVTLTLLNVYVARSRRVHKDKGFKVTVKKS